MASVKTMGRDELLKAIQAFEKENRQLAKLVSQQQADFDALTKLTRRIADNAPDMIWAKDLDNRYLRKSRNRSG